MSKEYFIENSYSTKENKKRKFVDKIFLNTRVYFVYKYIKEIMIARTLAIKDKYPTQAWAESSYNIFELVEDCGGKIYLEGLENIRKNDGPYVFVGNHMSTLETFLLPSIIGPLMEVTFVVKESLINHKLFGPVMKSRKPIVAKRKNAREDLAQVMNKGKELLQNGTSIIIFPQSTRSVYFCPEEFNTLGVKLAKSAKVKVIPFALKTDFWGNGKILKDVGPINRDKIVHIKFGEPFEVSGNGKDDHNNVIGFIKENIINWGGTIK